jgi:hypothetical protein
MRLTSVRYREFYSEGNQNPWELEELLLGNKNLVVGKNATGKSRIINVIHNMARLIQQPLAILNGEWIARFSGECEDELEFIIELKEGKILKESLLLNGVSKLERNSLSAKLYSNVSGWQEISPPNDRLVLHVRRDKNEFPFLESLVTWASNVKGFAFANTSTNMIEIPGNPSQLISLNAVPSALDLLSETQLKKVLDQLKLMGYTLESASTGFIAGLPTNAKMILLKEHGIAYPLKQFEISQGMFRAFSLLTIIEFLRAKNEVELILLDDFGEGLDFDRIKKLAEIIFDDKSQSSFQIVATSNDAFLMNSVELKNLTICYRSNHSVRCLNYYNSKERFEDWKQLSLNNFDLFSSNYLNEKNA